MRQLGLWLLLLTAAQAGAESVEGTVQDSVTRAPIRRAAVTLHSMSAAGYGAPNRSQPGPPGFQTAATDSGGRFRFDNVAPGSCQLMVRHPGYLGTASKTVTVGGTGTGGAITISLTPGAAISGRVLNEDGEPIWNCYPRLVRPDGRNVPSNSRGTDLDGEYRVTGIPAGKFKVSMVCSGRPFEPRPLTPLTQPVEQTMAYPEQFYPQGRSLAEAPELDLAAGAERGGVDFQMRPNRVFAVHVTLESPDGRDFSRFPPITGLSVGPTNTFDPRGQIGSRQTAPNTITFPAVFPGSYTLRSVSQGPSPLAAAAPIEVTDGPVAITLRLRAGTDIQGRVELDADSKVPVTQLQIRALSGFGGNRQPVSPDEAGNFVLKDVLPLVYRVEVSGTSDFVRSLSLGGTESEGNVVDFSTTSGELRIRMSSHTASLSGRAAPGSSIWLDQIRPGWPYVTQQSGITATPEGTYRFSGLAPGRYQVLAAPAGSGIPASGGQEITLAEGENATLDLKAVE